MGPTGYLRGLASERGLSLVCEVCGASLRESSVHGKSGISQGSGELRLGVCLNL